MRTTLSSYHRHSHLNDIQQELPMLAVAATLLVITSIAVYLYAAVQ